MIVSSTIFITIVFMCIWILLRYAEPSNLRTILIGIFIYWFMLFGIRLYDALYIGTYTADATYILELRNFYGGMIALWIYLLYPTYATYPKLYFSPNMLAAITPFVVTMVTYYVWCFGNGVYPSQHFSSYRELLLPENRVIFGFRIAMLVSFATYYGVANYSLLRITNLYQRYIDGTYSSSSYNIVWLKTYIKSLLLIGLVYFTATIYTNIYTIWIYVIGASATFMLLTDNALRFKQFTRNPEYEVKWSLRRRWHVIYHGEEIQEETQEATIEAHKENLFKEFSEWIERDKPYCSENFTLKEVTAAYPEWDYLAMQGILSGMGYTFQSYIRHLRIARAKELIKSSDSKLPLKQIAYSVGFSHISSFNRAFQAEMECTPGEYRASLTDKE